jgi:DNA replication protein DnaC
MSVAQATAMAIRAHLKPLKMPGAAREYDGLAREARERGWSHEEYLLEVLLAEMRSRETSVVRQRIHDARLPEVKTLDGFEFHAESGVDRDALLRLARCEWIDRNGVVILAGPVGTGKTHLAIALGVEAYKRRRRVLFTRAADLVRELVEARDQLQLGRLQRRLLRLDLLILDELGFVPFDRAGGELLFNVLSQRYERRATLLTTNLAFSEWPRVFAGDEKLTAALLDRLAHHAEVLTTKGQSYRMRQRARREAEAAGAALREGCAPLLGQPQQAPQE